MKNRLDGKHARMEKFILRKAFDLADQPYLLKKAKLVRSGNDDWTLYLANLSMWCRST